MTDVFAYTDYRKYLKDYYQEKKSGDSRFSCRFIAQKVGFRSPSFFSQILHGHCNMSMSMATRFSDFLKLKRKEAEYFESMVQFGQAKSPGDKDRWSQKLSSIRACKLRITEAIQSEFYEKWYHAAIRELLHFYPIVDEYEDLASLLSPPIKPSEAEQSVELLLRLDMIRRDAKGRLVRSDSASYSTGYEARTAAIRNFQLKTMALAGEAIDRFPRDLTSISTLTVGLSPKGFKSVEDELKSFRHKLLQIAEKDSGENMVYQINLQTFPVSKPPSGKRSRLESASWSQAAAD
jgi:uncharacterized protein (TIGR02147 family)